MERPGRTRMLLFRLHRFAARQAGAVTVEFVLMFPMLCWCFIASFTFFQAYRLNDTGVKAAYIIGDQLSRETSVIVPSYIDGLAELLDFLVASDTQPKIRITAFQYSNSDNTYRVIWSRGVGKTARLQGASITDVVDRLPRMGQNEVHVLTETWVDFNAFHHWGLDDMIFKEVVATRMRYSRLCWKDSPAADDSTAIC